MITSIRLCINHASRIRKLGLDRPRVEFKPGYNVIVGANGSGKSTLLKAIASCELCSLERSGGGENIRDGLMYLTTETLNPLAGGVFSSREAMVQGIRAMFQSHGQGVLDSLRSMAHGEEAVVVIDSPETGQDHGNSELIYHGLLKMAEKYQVIIATNSLVFMRSGHLIDLGEDTVRRLAGATQSLLAEMDAPESGGTPAVPEKRGASTRSTRASR